MPSIRLEKVSAKIGGKWVLRDVNLKIENRSFTVICGPQGSGKTTLLRIIARLIKPTEGRVFMDDVDVTDIPTYKGNLAFVFEGFALYPHMSVFDNMATCLRVKGLSGSEIKTRVERVASLLKIQHLLDRKSIRTLSGGERQRVALARALVRDADVYLLDEPLARLDYKFRESLRVEFLSLRKMLKAATFVYSTPDVYEAMILGDMAAVLVDGRLRQYDTPVNIYNNPRDTETARFFSNMNLVTGSVIDSEGRLYFKSGTEQIDLTALGDLIGKEEEIILGIRPGDISIDGDLDIKLKANVLLTENIGNEFITTFLMGNSQLKCHHNRPLTGKEACISFDYENIYLFDKNGLLLGKGEL